jgi:hypothetical protein
MFAALQNSVEEAEKPSRIGTDHSSQGSKQSALLRAYLILHVQQIWQIYFRKKMADLQP